MAKRVISINLRNRKLGVSGNNIDLDWPWGISAEKRVAEGEREQLCVIFDADFNSSRKTDKHIPVFYERLKSLFQGDKDIILGNGTGIDYPCGRLFIDYDCRKYRSEISKNS